MARDELRDLEGVRRDDRAPGEPPRARPGRPEAHLPPALARPFRLIAFDWDGTAVVNRHEEAGPVRALLERLLYQGVLVVVITGTNFPNVDRQLSAHLRGPHKRNLFVATNRGSEVYGFDDASRPVARWRREATATEDRLLTEVAEAVRDEVIARTGLPIRIVYDRLNRRKIDVIPLPDWADPPKSAIGTLLDVVEARLRSAGLCDGLREVFRLAEAHARRLGLDARITSDVKHVEVGLTDKADSIGWLAGELARPRAIASSDILIVGDEFGPVAGFEGSDFKMVTPAGAGAVYASVGPEPGGTPAGVIHVGGGPARFRELLATQLLLHERARLAGGDGRSPVPETTRAPPAVRRPLDLPLDVTADATWTLVEEGWHPAREHEIESLFTVANGYVGTRGSVPEGSALSTPATFIAGVFDQGPQTTAVPELVAAPDWLHVRVQIDGETLSLDRGKILEHRRTLDMRQGVLWRDWRHEDPQGRVTRVRALRLASLADRHALLQAITITPENYSGTISIETGVSRPAPADPTVPVLEPVQPVEKTLPDAASTLSLRARGRGTAVALASTARLRSDAGVLVAWERDRGEAQHLERWRLDAALGQTYRLDRLVTVHTSRDTDAPGASATRTVGRLLQRGLQASVESHARAWERRWRHADVLIDGDDALQRAVRFAAYHLISTANPEDERVSIGARALTGRSYKGHVFWDTEIFMLPFYTLTDPPTARALLRYRWHTLPEARRKAFSLGYRGALYPWESADTGEETTPPYVIGPDGAVVQVLSGIEEQHISADVAYAVWQYAVATGDRGFLRDGGAEILIETARFWASRGRFEDDGRFHIRRVMGPDEYHETIDDNAFTNVMAAWNLERALEVARLLEREAPDAWRELAARLDLEAGELAAWERIAGAVVTGLDPQSGLLEQFAGYFDLEDIDLSAYAWRQVPMDVVLGRERVQGSQVVKQADVVMLLALLWERFSPAERLANYRYYEPRTGHGSSLSPPMHALVAARLGDERQALRYLQQTAEIDLGNNMGNAAGGVHAAALGGLWQAIVFGLGGVRPSAGGLAVDPRLPASWRGLEFGVHWRGGPLRVRLEPGALVVTLDASAEAPASIRLEGGARTTIEPGRRGSVLRRSGRWGAWQG